MNKHTKFQADLFDYQGRLLSQRGFKPDAHNRLRAAKLGAIKMSGDDANKDRKRRESKGERLLFGTFDGSGTQVPAINLTIEQAVRHIKSYEATIETAYNRLDEIKSALNKNLKSYMDNEFNFPTTDD